MDTSEKQWFVMRDLRHRTSNTLAIHELAEAGLEVFTPMTQMIMTIRGRRQRREVPVIQDLLFVHEAKDALDVIVEKCSSLQYRYQLGKPTNEPMTVRKDDMERFIFAVRHTQTPLYYTPSELTKSMLGKRIRIVGGVLDAYEGHLLSLKGLRKRRVIIGLSGIITVAVEIEPEFIQPIS